MCGCVCGVCCVACVVEDEREGGGGREGGGEKEEGEGGDGERGGEGSPRLQVPMDAKVEGESKSRCHAHCKTRVV